MNCWECNRPAHGACKFCGRGVCKEHFSERISIVTDIDNKSSAPQVIITQKALFCGKCKPMGEPISLEEE